MKKILKFTVLSAVFLMLVGLMFSCNEVEKNETQFGTGRINPLFEAKVANASEFSNVVAVKVMVFDTTSPVEIARGDWKDGGFTIELPQTLAPNHLRPLVGGIGANHPTNMGGVAQQTAMDISNRDVRIVDARFVGIDKNGNAIVTFWPTRSERDRHGQTSVRAFFTYVDSDVTLSGYRILGAHVQSMPGFPAWLEETITYSVKWENGWNVWYRSTHSMVDNDRGMFVASIQWSTTPVYGLKWYGTEIMGF
jgi:hypothetical protein